jgi:pyruvate dehydrogenase E2 component (dihydrolipoamide acetyltransferase)
MPDLIPVIVPQELINDETVRLIAWHRSAGDPVDADELLLEVETSKAVMEIYAPCAGYLSQLLSVGEDVAVGSPVCFISEDLVIASDIAHSAPSPQPPATDSSPAPRLTRPARRLAEELRLDTSIFPRGALVRTEDLLRATRLGTGVLADKDSECPTKSLNGVRIEWQALSKRKAAEASALQRGLQAAVRSSVTLPHPIAELRAAIAAEDSGGSVTALIIFEVGRLLRKHPLFNAVYSAGRLGLYPEVNIGWALDDGEGLAVPVIRNADRKSLTEIIAETDLYSAAYVRNAFSQKDLAGATFTISDLSHRGVAAFSPLITYGQSAILGVSASSFTLAFDHQLAEGYSAAQFLKELSDALQAHGAERKEPIDLVCSFCGSSATELRSNRSFLLPCELPAKGHVCSLCLVSA